MAKHRIDITGEHCPMTFVKVRLKLDELEKNDVLEVLLKEGEPLEGVPKTMEECGCEVLSIDSAGEYFLITAKK